MDPAAMEAIPGLVIVDAAPTFQQKAERRRVERRMDLGNAGEDRPRGFVIVGAAPTFQKKAGRRRGEKQMDPAAMEAMPGLAASSSSAPPRRFRRRLNVDGGRNRWTLRQWRRPGLAAGHAAGEDESITFSTSAATAEVAAEVAAARELATVQAREREGIKDGGD